MNEFFLSVSEFFVSFQKTVIFDILISVFSSFLFIFILLFAMRPKIKISPYICYAKVAPEDEYYFIFKIVNRSLFYCFDVNINLVKKEPHIVNRGSKINHRIVEIETSSKFKNHLPKSKRKQGYGDHAYLIRTKYDLMEDIENKDITIQLSISSKHGLTNLTKIETQNFTSIDNVHKDKEFKFGKCLNITG